MKMMVALEGWVWFVNASLVWIQIISNLVWTSYCFDEPLGNLKYKMTVSLLSLYETVQQAFYNCILRTTTS